jgi:hypothetical protein
MCDQADKGKGKEVKKRVVKRQGQSSRWGCPEFRMKKTVLRTTVRI